MFSRELELLAPAGKWDVLESVVQAGADAVYLGGKKFNMRMLRPDLNFSDDELKRAVDYLHQKHKKLYVTINSLYYENEINELREHLLFLGDINVDALIVQDIGVVDVCEELGLRLPWHASVQMGLANSRAVNFLEQRGFKRVILSKNLSLAEINEIHQETNLGIEFFAHGDLCIAHAGRCYMSNLIFAHSGNRGLCKKPCRWQYRLEGSPNPDNEYKYYLANNDLCVYPHLSDLVKAGVTSFKIEGRMRTADYLSFLINKYRQALDRLADDFEDYQADQAELDDLYQHRARNFTTANLFGKPGLEAVNLNGEREPKFPTAPIPLPSLKKNDNPFKGLVKPGLVPELTVKAGSLEIFQQLCHTGIDNIVLGMEIIRQNRDNWTPSRVDQALHIARDSQVKVLLETPRILSQDNLPQVEKYLKLANIDRLDGVVLNDYGSMQLFENSPTAPISLWGGPGFNITNSRAGDFLTRHGLKRLTASLEMDVDMIKTLTTAGLEVEVMIHGPLCGIITDFCLYQAVNNAEDKCSGYCKPGGYALVDEYGQKYNLLTDSQCRNYLFYPYDLCLFPYLPVLKEIGVKSLKIEGQHYDDGQLIEVVQIYRQALQMLEDGKWEPEKGWHQLLEMSPRGLTASPVFSEPRG